MKIPYGRRLLPQVLDQLADAEPSTLYARYACASALEDWETNGTNPYRSLTYANVAKAVDRVAWWLDGSLGSRKGEADGHENGERNVNGNWKSKLETFAYSGADDLRYVLLMLAAMKTGRKMLVPDGRLTGEGRRRLLNLTACRTWIASADKMDDAADLAKEDCGMRIVEMPSFESWLEGDVERYSYEKTFKQAKHDLAFIIHTSGTTGFPKPIFYNMAMIATFDACRGLTVGKPETEWTAINRLLGCRYLCTIPPQWVAGLHSLCIAVLFWERAVVLLPPNAPRPPTAEYIDRIHQLDEVDGGFYPPALLKEFCTAQIPGPLQRLKRLEFVNFAGAPLEEWVGNMLCKETRVLSTLGSTEAGLILQYEPAVPEEWQYIRFHPATGVRMVKQDGFDGLYELVIDRKPEYEAYQAIFHVHPELDCFPMEDLYTQHPTKPDLWRSCGRADDLVKLSFLAKFHARDIESAVEAQGKVRGALMDGQGRDVPFLLIELKESDLTPEKREAAREEIWQAVKTINAKDTEEIRIPKDMIMLTDPTRPLQRTLKMTLNRRAILETYRDAIDELYKRHEQPRNGVSH